jgi:hypothetical protein
MNSIDKIAMGAKPDPYNFKLVELRLVNGNTIITANYPGSLTFGGNKMMLLKGDFTQHDFETLDPHFLDDDYAVVARFVPNAAGKKLAIACAKLL